MRQTIETLRKENGEMKLPQEISYIAVSGTSTVYISVGKHDQLFCQTIVGFSTIFV
jgi:hypothetical protein